jgi:hypothetical protein
VPAGRRVPGRRSVVRARGDRRRAPGAVQRPFQVVLSRSRRGTGSPPSGSIGTWRTPGSPPRACAATGAAKPTCCTRRSSSSGSVPGWSVSTIWRSRSRCRIGASTSPSTRSTGSAGRWSRSATGPSCGACAALPGRSSCGLRRRRAAARDRAPPVRAARDRAEAVASARPGSGRRWSPACCRGARLGAPPLGPRAVWNEPSRVRWVTPQRKIPAFAIHFLISA